MLMGFLFKRFPVGVLYRLVIFAVGATALLGFEALSLILLLTFMVGFMVHEHVASKVSKKWEGLWKS